MNERIVYTRISDGGVSVEIPTPGTDINELLAKVQSRPDASNVRLVTTAEVPSDRTFREAWDDSNPEPYVGVNVAKAKLITHNKRRAKREVELSPLDKEVNIKAGNPTAQAAAEASRQVIRDRYTAIQTEIDACTTTTELKAIIDREGF